MPTSAQTGDASTSSAAAASRSRSFRRRGIKSTRETCDGEVVQARSQGEILATLDADGTLDGLPFKAEMSDFCGRRFRISRRVEKTCVEVGCGNYDIREFGADDVVFVEGLGCTAAGHDGCQRACMLLWKDAWLRSVEAGAPSAAAGGGAVDQLPLDSRRWLDQGDTPVNRPSSRVPIGRLQRYGRSSSACRRRPLLDPYGAHRSTSSTRSPGKSSKSGQSRTSPSPLTRGAGTAALYDLGLKQFSGRSYRPRNRLDRMILEPTEK